RAAGRRNRARAAGPPKPAAAPAATPAPAAQAAPPAAPKPAEATKPAAAPAAAAPAKTGAAAAISLSVWPDVADLEINNGIIGAFQQKSPNVKVTPEQWTNSGNSGYYQKLQV